MTLTVYNSEIDTKLCQTWTNNLRSAQNARMSFEQQWHKNLSFYSGRQWITVGKSPDGNGFVLSNAPQTDRFRVRHTANRIKRTIRNEITKLSKEEPEFYTEPDSTDESDRAAARAADAIAEWLIINKQFRLKRTEATFWATICGTSFLKNWYDKNLTDLDGKPGRIDFEAVTAFHLFVPYLQITDIQRQPWIIHAWTMGPEEVWARYGVEVDPSTNSADTILDSRFLSSVGINQDQGKSKMCYVKEVWVKPCKNFPNGAMFVLSDNKVLDCYEPSMLSPQPEQLSLDTMDKQSGFVSTDNDGPPEPNTPVGTELDGHLITQGREYQFPLTHTNFPFAKIDHIPSGCFYADSTIKDLITLQKEYNRTRSQMLEYRNMATKPQYSMTKGAFNPQHLTAKPGLLLAVNLGFEPPKPIEHPELPPTVANDLSIILGDWDFAAGQNEISQGRTPPGVEAASAIAYLQEENDSLFFITTESIEAAVEETGRQVLTLVHDYWDEERIVTIASRNQTYEVRKFKAADLKPRSDFRVITGSMAPRSAAAKQAQIIEFVKMGWITPEQAMPYIQMNEANALYKQLRVDNDQIMRENMKMADGEPINIRMEPNPAVDPNNLETMMGGQPMMLPRTKPVLDEFGQPTGETNIVTINSYDNHQRHVDGHQAFMKTQEFEMLDPKIKQIFEDHVDEHKMELIEEMRYSQMGVTGNPAEPGTPPGGQEEMPIQEGEVVNA